MAGISRAGVLDQARRPDALPGRRVHRLLGEHRAALWGHFGDAADDEDALSDDPVLVDFDHARANRRDQRRMARQYAEITLGAGHHHHLDIGREDETLRCHQLELNAIGHHASLALLPALSTASSTVPTI